MNNWNTRRRMNEQKNILEVIIIQNFPEIQKNQRTPNRTDNKSKTKQNNPRGRLYST